MEKLTNTFGLGRADERLRIMRMLMTTKATLMRGQGKIMSMTAKATSMQGRGSRGAKLLVPNSKSGVTSAKWSLAKCNGIRIQWEWFDIRILVP
ncbi:hypothetical protein Tco_0833048 [Tanacetum coccineum]